MEALDDAFLRCLASLSGQTIDFLPGVGGFDDALNSLAFHDLCAKHGITCEPIFQAAGTGDRMIVAGSIEVVLCERTRLAGRRIIVLPGSLSRFEQLKDGFSHTTTVFWRDRTSHRMAILQGLPHDRSVLCHPLAIHLDATALVSTARAPAGALTLDVDGQPTTGSGDRVSIRLDGRDDRWASPPSCRSAVRSVAGLMADAAEIRTDDPSLAILAARLGKAVRLGTGRGCSNRNIFDDTIASLHPGVSLDSDGSDARGPVRDASPSDAGDEVPASVVSGDEVARLQQLLTAARREAQHLTQERDRLFIVTDELRDRRDAEAVAVVRSHRAARERAEQAERRATDRLAEAEARAAQACEAATSAAERLSALQAVGEVALETAAREAKMREEALNRQLAASEAALDTRTHQALTLQAALDVHGARTFATEGRIARMRALIDARTASGEEARRNAEIIGRRLDEIVSSVSWRLTRPLRKLSRGIRRLTGFAAGARHG